MKLRFESYPSLRKSQTHASSMWFSYLKILHADRILTLFVKDPLVSIHIFYCFGLVLMVDCSYSLYILRGMADKDLWPAHTPALPHHHHHHHRNSKDKWGRQTPGSLTEIKSSTAIFAREVKSDFKFV